MIPHQLKAFKISQNLIDWINEVQVCSIRINVSKYDVTFATKGGFNPQNPSWLRYWIAASMHTKHKDSFSVQH